MLVDVTHDLFPFNFLQVNLNSCNKVTDDGLFFVNESLGNSTEKTSFPKISVQDTSVKYASSIKGKILAGHPVFPIVGGKEITIVYFLPLKNIIMV